jgi:EAL domain-containing protein (putative c-di-GMP-specific phosphodiesterase class I)/GGDEF domain-containing protein/CheY-like chemotaxis protein
MVFDQVDEPGGTGQAIRTNAAPDAGHEEFLFAPEADVPTADGAVRKTLTVLTVDDDADFQRSLRLALGSFRYQGHLVDLITASSATQAARMLSQRPDVSVIVLDIVMETDDAGLRLVKSVREILGNAEVRIILVTGQPGVASMQASLDTLDISDYWLKTDLTYERLHGILTSNLRTWEQIRALRSARRGLQAIVEASNSLTRAQGLPDFSGRMVRELAHVLGLEPDGMMCVQEVTSTDPHAALVVGAAGRFINCIAKEVAVIADPDIRNLLVSGLTEQRNIETPTSQVLFFRGADAGPHAAAYLATGRTLDATERELLSVFASNINSGLINVSLTSRLDRLAYEDSLLAIPNANALLRAVESVMAVPAPRDRSLLFIDLDKYSQSCLSLGIEQGDLMLMKMAQRLRVVFPPPCMVARLHDDTFGILGQTALLRADHVDRLESWDPEDPTNPPFIGVGASRIDLDRYKGSARSAMAMGTLLLKQARAQGLSQLIDYEPGMESASNQRFNQSHELYHALHHNEIRIELQPQIELATGRIVGAEALARWTRADGSHVPPSEFVTVAEANGLIVPLGRQVIELACAALAKLRDAGHPGLSIAVNVSPLQLSRREFPLELADAVRRHGVAPAQLELEITESAAMEDHQAKGEILGRLRTAGFPIAIDDFGTGYSSLGYLRSLPVTTLKVDRCFVAEIGVVRPHLAIADMIVLLGQRLHMKVLAEGVETEEQADWLRSRGCMLAQGYLYARPEPLAAFLARLGTTPTALPPAAPDRAPT